MLLNFLMANAPFILSGIAMLYAAMKGLEWWSQPAGDDVLETLNERNAPAPAGQVVAAEPVELSTRLAAYRTVETLDTQLTALAVEPQTRQGVREQLTGMIAKSVLPRG